MTSVYLAAAYSSRDVLRAKYLPTLDDCTSTWLTETHEITKESLRDAPAMTEQYVFDHVQMDIRDVKRSDVFVAITDDWLRSQHILAISGGGRHVEMGVAMSLGIPVLVLGEPENIFQRVWHSVATWEELLTTLQLF